MRIASLLFIPFVFFLGSPAWALKSKDVVVTFTAAVSATGASYRTFDGETFGDAAFGDSTLFQPDSTGDVGIGYRAGVGAAYYVSRFLSVGASAEYAYHPFALRFHKNTANEDLVFSSDFHVVKFPVLITGYFLPFFLSGGLSFDQFLYNDSAITMGDDRTSSALGDAKGMPSFVVELGVAIDPTPTSRLTASLRLDQTLGANFAEPYWVTDFAIGGIAFQVGYQWKWGD